MVQTVENILDAIEQGISREDLQKRLLKMIDQYGQDTKLLDWMERMSIACPGLVNDDNSNWAVSFSGTQNVPLEKEPQTIYTSFIVEPNEWKPTVREAIIAAMEEYGDE